MVPDINRPYNIEIVYYRAGLWYVSMQAFQNSIHFSGIPILLKIPPSQSIFIQFNKETTNIKIINLRTSLWVWYIKYMSQLNGTSVEVNLYFWPEFQDCCCFYWKFIQLKIITGLLLITPCIYPTIAVNLSFNFI